MNKNEVRGKARQLKGRVKEAAGVVIGSRHLENEGAAERTGGEIEAGLGKARRKVGAALAGLGKAIKR
jgi:uncharacterized protein YjbJ (UPF0337 family)